jgi:hypothetical protein
MVFILKYPSMCYFHIWVIVIVSRPGRGHDLNRIMTQKKFGSWSISVMTDSGNDPKISQKHKI